MGDISIIARRLTDGHVQYGWSGNGGYFRNVGLRLLAWYDDPEKIEYLFGLGELTVIGKPGSENGGFEWYNTHNPTGCPHSLGTTEREIFSKIMFIDYGYLYDTDQRWYYVIPGPFRIKIPLMHIFYATEGGKKYEFEHIQEIQYEIVRYMLGDYLAGDPVFAALLKEKQIDPGKLLTELLEDDDPTYQFFDCYNSLFSYFDDWILAVTGSGDWKIERYIMKPKTEKHIETIDWI